MGGICWGESDENYDDWWRCEIRFTPELDELFGVTHSKQGVSPRAELKLLLSSDFEAVARTLNRRVRIAFERTKGTGNPIAAINASRRDALLPPPASLSARTITSGGLRYRLDYRPIPVPDFYSVRVTRNSVVVSVNTDHPLLTEIYQRASGPTGCGLKHLDGLVLAAARANLEARNVQERQQVRHFASSVERRPSCLPRGLLMIKRDSPTGSSSVSWIDVTPLAVTKDRTGRKVIRSVARQLESAK